MGIMIDSLSFEIRLPEDKLFYWRVKQSKFNNKPNATPLELQSLIELLHVLIKSSLWASKTLNSSAGAPIMQSISTNLIHTLIFFFSNSQFIIRIMLHAIFLFAFCAFILFVGIA